MATIEDVARLATGLPEVTAGERHGNLTWSVNGKGFAWERPFSKADIKRFGTTAPPGGPIAAVRVLDLAEKEAVRFNAPPGFFTIPHFDGYAAVLIELQAVSTNDSAKRSSTPGWHARRQLLRTSICRQEKPPHSLGIAFYDHGRRYEVFTATVMAWNRVKAPSTFVSRVAWTTLPFGRMGMV